MQYNGFRVGGERCVVKRDNGTTLPPFLEFVNHSPDGFEWGYGGSGPSQLAFALLYDVTHDLEFTRKFYQKFKADVISTLPRYEWSLTDLEIKSVIDFYI